MWRFQAGTKANQHHKALQLIFLFLEFKLLLRRCFHWTSLKPDGVCFLWHLAHETIKDRLLCLGFLHNHHLCSFSSVGGLVSVRCGFPSSALTLASRSPKLRCPAATHVFITAAQPDPVTKKCMFRNAKLYLFTSLPRIDPAPLDST